MSALLFSETWLNTVLTVTEGDIQRKVRFGQYFMGISYCTLKLVCHSEACSCYTQGHHGCVGGELCIVPSVSFTEDKETLGVYLIVKTIWKYSCLFLRWSSLFTYLFSQGEIYFELSADKICRATAQMLLQNAVKFNLAEFQEVWQQSVPEGMVARLDQLQVRERWRLLLRLAKSSVITRWNETCIGTELGANLLF